MTKMEKTGGRREKKIQIKYEYVFGLEKTAKQLCEAKCLEQPS